MINAWLLLTGLEQSVKEQRVEQEGEHHDQTADQPEPEQRFERDDVVGRRSRVAAHDHLRRNETCEGTSYKRNDADGPANLA